MKAVVFSGTSEGKEITEYLSQKGIDTLVSVATTYGKSVMPPLSNVTVHIGRLNKEKMLPFLAGADLVIDATHPYALEVTENIKHCCNSLNLSYIRLLREKSDFSGVIEVDSVKEAVNYLKNTDGNIFVSTGSKELNLYAEISDYKNRIFARVLPIAESIEKCRSLGLKNVIYKKGPFTIEENVSDFKNSVAKWLVTKSSGKAGGFEEKLQASKKLGINTIVIKRPEENGLSMSELKSYIDKRLKPKRRFPLFIDLTDKNILVVGGGSIAVRRINTLLEFGANIKIVSKELNIENIKGAVEFMQREFQPQDIEGMFMVISCTDDRELNHKIYELCKQKNIVVNVSDCKEETDFYFPAVCFKDSVTIGLVSDGDNHKLVSETAKSIRSCLYNE